MDRTITRLPWPQERRMKEFNVELLQMLCGCSECHLCDMVGPDRIADENGLIVTQLPFGKNTPDGE
jgi:hypothetical protein